MLGFAWAIALPRLYMPGAYGDDAVYVALSRALARGVGYRSAWLPGSPAHVQYPPGLPVVLAPVWALGGGVVVVAVVARVLNVVLVGITAALLWKIAVRRLGASALTGALFVVGPLFLDSSLQYFGLALAEPWFMALWAVALVTAYRATEGDGAAAVAGLALGLAALFRAQAAPLIPAFALGIGLRTRRVRTAAVALGAGLVPIAGWSAVHAAMLAGTGAVGSQQSYLTDLLSRGGLASALLSNLWFNIRGYVLLFSLFTSFWPVLGVLLVAGFSGLALIGGMRLWRAQPELVLTCAANAAVILFWPYNIDRFVVSALPFVGVLAASGADRVVGRLGRRPRRMAGVALLLLVGQVAARQVQLRVRGLRDAGTGERPAFWTPSWQVPYFDRFVRLASGWVADRAAPNARILTPWPVAIWLHTGRTTFDAEASLPGSTSSAAEGTHESAGALARMIVRDSIDVVVVGHPDQTVAREVRALLARCGGDLVLERTEPPYGLPAFYRVGRRSGCIAAAAAARPENR